MMNRISFLGYTIDMSDTEPEETILVMITYPEASSPDPDRFAGDLVEQNLAACVNVLSDVKSFFQWEDSLEEADELLLIAKTTRNTYDELEQHVQETHPYDEPEVVGISLDEGAPSYLNWVESTLT